MTTTGIGDIRSLLVSISFLFKLAPTGSDPIDFNSQNLNLACLTIGPD